MVSRGEGKEDLTILFQELEVQPVPSSRLNPPPTPADPTRSAKAELLAPLSDAKRMRRREDGLATALQYRSQDQTRVCPLPKPGSLPKFSDADVEGRDGLSLAETNSTPEPAVMGGGGHFFPSVGLLIACLPGNSLPSRPAASGGSGATCPRHLMLLPAGGGNSGKRTPPPPPPPAPGPKYSGRRKKGTGLEPSGQREPKAARKSQLAPTRDTPHLLRKETQLESRCCPLLAPPYTAGAGARLPGLVQTEGRRGPLLLAMVRRRRLPGLTPKL